MIVRRKRGWFPRNHSGKNEFFLFTFDHFPFHIPDDFQFPIHEGNLSNFTCFLSIFPIPDSTTDAYYIICWLCLDWFNIWVFRSKNWCLPLMDYICECVFPTYFSKILEKHAKKSVGLKKHVNYLKCTPTWERLQCWLILPYLTRPMPTIVPIVILHPCNFHDQEGESNNITAELSET